MRFIAGDELGNLKILRFEENKITQKVARTGSLEQRSSVQVLATAPSENGSALLAAACADGTASAFRLQPDDTFDEIEKWTEPRMKAGARYVGLSATNESIFSCTSNGALRMITATDNSDHKTTYLPTRLCDWRLSKSHETFAYGGDEVDLSVWSTEKAFSTETGYMIGQKRKRDALFPGEIWRAKNVPNDHLGLRKPIRITSLSYVRSLESQLLVGTQLGSMRRYDTRAARRPVADWNDVARVGGVKTIECGLNEHEAFVSDGGSNLFSLDLRNGQISYAYKGISGAVASIAPSTSVMATVAQDRFIRIHSVYPPPMEVGRQQKQKGEVLDKTYTKIMPTVIVWDQCTVEESSRTLHADEDYEDVWNGMEEIGDDGNGEHSRPHKKRLQ